MTSLPADPFALADAPDSMAALARRAAQALHKLGVTEPESFTQAPGRVNLLGEHTDYNDGFVLPCTLDRATMTAWARRDDRRLRVFAADADRGVAVLSLEAPLPPNAPAWARYVHAMATVLDHHAPGRLQGADLGIAGNVPAGAGLSSSAALLLSVGHALAAAAALDIDPVTLARLAQRAENDHVGCRCGIMDPLVSACGAEAHALFIDCRTLQHRRVPLSPDIGILIAHSRVRRELRDSAYNDRRDACEQAARALGVPALRDANLESLEAAQRKGRLDPVLARRARHVIGENARTLVAAQALDRGDLRTLGPLMRASHDALRDDFEVSVPAMDRLVALMQAAIGEEGGARMTGGGFGGCAVAVMPASRLEAVAAAVAAGYRSPEGLPAGLLLVRPGPGAGVWPGPGA